MNTTVSIASADTNFNITSQHFRQVIRDKNITRKRTRHKHYLKERYGKATDIKRDMKNYSLLSGGINIWLCKISTMVSTKRKNE